MDNIRHYLCIGLAVLAAGCGIVGCIDSNGETSEDSIMTTREDQAAQLLKLSADDFFTFEEDQQLELQDALATLFEDGDQDEPAGSGPLVLVLGAPERVSLAEQSVVPVLVGRMQSGLRSWEVNYKTNLHLFIKDLATGGLWDVQPLASMRRGGPQLLSGKGEAPDELNALKLQSSVALVDLQKKLDGRLKPGRIVITAVAFDLLSNSVAMELEDGSQKLKLDMTAVPQAYIKPMSDMNIQLETKVAVPEKITMTGRAFVEVAIQVGELAGVQRAESGEVFWTCNLIFMKLDEQPEIVPATVPVSEIITPDGAPAFNAVFQVDLDAVTGELGDGKFQVFLDVGLEILGPFSLTISN